ncbi:MAG: amidohydrolase family protein [Oligoflexia bacterium]|nr:amidohydrolase family protein [Oligoflexia bacterium]
MTTLPNLRIDAHVHILGDGSAGSGCWLKLQKPYHKLLARIVLRGLGLPGSALKSGLDALYIDSLVKMVRESSIDAAVILAHENVYDENGKLVPNFGSFYTPNDYVLKLGKLYPDCFIPAVAIHPARPDAMEELERCIESGAAMLKLLPNCQNVNCSDKRFSKFWERLAAAHMPFLAHTGGELSVPVFNAKYASPEVLTLPLECGVNVIAAHCGTPALLWDRNYTETFIQMTKRHPNLYGDNSGMNTPLRSKHFGRLLSEEASERIIHGSDLPIPISATWNLLRGSISAGGWREAQATRNLIERDARIKTALGFEARSFSRILGLLPAGVAERMRE